ncbi:hypothetical protein Y032_0004g1960 [Ancylostoma ceylanicum]|uniref:Uncharacterized protein n=1 Tax=Ancylostoma ceylanicum TaxID=53326 RepID=A0A016VUX3_9BILA|nr:hypothetical protein Y032_0004g1960 [Ancylostoma ceylanicum]
MRFGFYANRFEELVLLTKIVRPMSSNDGGSRDCESIGNSGDEMRGFQMEQGRAVDSPLGQLDPSRITHMVVDQVGFGGPGVQPDNDRFVVPGPPHQQWIRSSPAASPSVMASPSKAMDGCGQMQPRMGTPTNVMHMQQGTIGSPSVGSAPMTPQQMMQQQGLMQGQQTPTGQYDQSGGFPQQQQQMPQGYPQGISESPGAMHMQQQQMMGAAGGQGDGSPGIYARQQQMMGQQQQQQQQQMLSQQQQQQQMMGQQMMVQQQMGMMGGNPQQYYAQQNPQAQWTQQQQQMQQAHFVRQPQVIGGAPGQRVMIQRVPYPPGTGYPAGMQGVPQQQQQPQGVVAQPGNRPPGAPPPQQAQRPAYPPGAAPQPPQYAYPGGQAAGFQQQQAAQAAAYQQQMYQRQQQVPQHQQMRPYMSPQGTMVTPTHQAGTVTKAIPSSLC